LVSINPAFKHGVRIRSHGIAASIAPRMTSFNPPGTTMSSKVHLPTQLPKRRFLIQDRAHARRIAEAIAFDDLFKKGGTAKGFADWLFLKRRTFNAGNPLQQPRVYVRRLQAAKKHGVDFDAQCAVEASKQEETTVRIREAFEANLSTIKSWWSETPVGPDISMALADLSLGRGHRFAASPDAKSPSETPPSWVLEWLLDLLEVFGGPDDSLHVYMVVFSEDYFREQLAEYDLALVRIREAIPAGRPLTETDYVCLTRVAQVLSRRSTVRTSVRAFLRQAWMVERICG
jgi:hypothetical protein